MTEFNTQSLLGLLCIGVLTVGCASEVKRGNAHELSGEYHLAYEQYLVAVGANPDDAAAAQGLRRTVDIAAAYWEAQAFKEAENGRWDRAAEHHLKVLKIKPNEFSSILSLRQIARHHAEDFKLACKASSADGLLVVPMATATIQSAVARDGQPPEALKQPITIARALEGFTLPVRIIRRHANWLRAAFVPFASHGLHGKRLAAAAGLARTDFGQRPSRPDAVTLGESPELPAPPGSNHGARPPAEPLPAQKPRRLPTPAQDSTQAAPRPPQAAVSRKDLIGVGCISLSDKRYPKRAYLVNGLTIELRDIDIAPVDADIEIHLCGKFLASHMDLQEGSTVIAKDKFATPYEIIIMQIQDANETVTIGFRRK